MITDTSVWHYYQPGFVHPEFVPYMREKVKDYAGNTIEINKWKKQGPRGMVEPALVRVNKGLDFMRMFDTDPCPTGFKKGDNAMCHYEGPFHNPVFYTDKAFIAQRQFFQGYSDGDPTPRRVSEPTDLRSVNPFTGKYTVYYLPHTTRDGKQKYATPNDETEKIWNQHRNSSYQGLRSTDSFLA